MKFHYRFLLIFFLMLFVSISSQAQIWPFRSMIRFAHTVYYRIDSLSDENIRRIGVSGQDTLVSDRYFDIQSGSDSIKILINDNANYFHQSNRSEPKNYKAILFYSRRKLRTENIKFKYLKLIELNQSSIIAEASMKMKSDHKTHSIKENIMIPKSEINGVFLGTGKNYRTTFTYIEIGAIIGGIVFAIYL